MKLKKFVIKDSEQRKLVSDMKELRKNSPVGEPGVPHPEGMPESWTKTRPADRTFPVIPESVEETEGLCPIMKERCTWPKGAIHGHYSSERTGGVPGSQHNERERI